MVRKIAHILDKKRARGRKVREKIKGKEDEKQVVGFR